MQSISGTNGIDVNPSNQISLAEIQEINRSFIRYIEALTPAEIQRRIKEVIVDDFHSVEGMRAARQILDECGIVVIPGVVSEKVCATAQEAVDKLYSDHVGKNESVYESDYALFQMGTAKLKGYHQMARYGKAVISVRQGQDEGMIDIFNCDLALPDATDDIRRVFEDPAIGELLNRPSLRPRNLNVYINRAITHTRGFHVDSYSENLKAFIYISDVTALADGPYTFVKRSHKESAFHRVNKYLCRELKPSTETPVLDPCEITPVIAPRGSLVISDQAGSHRGWPQSATANRMVAVMKYA